MLGDLVLKLGSLKKDIYSKVIFLELVNPYLKKFEEIKDFSYEILTGIFDIKNPSEFCLYEQMDEKISKEEINDYAGFYQYSLLLKK